MVEEILIASFETAWNHRCWNLKGLTIGELVPKGTATANKIMVKIPNGKRLWVLIANEISSGLKNFKIISELVHYDTEIIFIMIFFILFKNSNYDSTVLGGVQPYVLVHQDLFIFVLCYLIHCV